MKNIKYLHSIVFLLLGLVVFSTTGCERDISEDAVKATFPKNGVVFIDGFSSGLEYRPFGDSFFKAFTVDKGTKYAGTAAMRFDVPSEGDPDGSYAGAIFPDYGGRDLSDFDALTFWAKGSKAATINDVGFGQDFEQNKYQVALKGALRLSTNWKKYTIPIPDPSKLTQEKGLFWYAEGPEENGNGYTFWIDELKFEKLGTIAQPRPKILNGEDVTEQSFVGASIVVSGLTQTFNLETGIDQTINVAPSYFTFTSSNPSVATVNELGKVTILSAGETTITAKLGGVDAQGSLKIRSAGSFSSAPVPTLDPSNVISIFSDAYENVPVDYYNGFWEPFQTTLSADFAINGDNVLSYTNFNFVGTSFSNPTVNASQMTHAHFDIFIPDVLDPGAQLKITIRDFGADGVDGGNDDSNLETIFSSADLSAGEWTGLDIPLTQANKSNLGLIIYENNSTNLSGFYADNIYFYNGSGGEVNEPSSAAPTPTQNAANVISIYSDAYSNLANTDYNPGWGQSTVYSEVSINGNNTMLYSGLNYQGIALAGSQDISGMQFLHIDYWTANSSMLNTFLISSGPVETAKALSVPTMGWNSMDIPLSDFSPVDLANLIQMKFDGNGDIYLDNIYFYTEGGGATEPTTAAPTPTQNAANVISIYSDAYSNLANTDYNPGWGQSTVYSEVSINGNNTMLYSGLNYQGIALAASQDISGMQFLHIDYWTANSSMLNTFLISPGPVETAKALSVPTMGWNSIDIPLSDFSPVDLANLIQMKFDGNGDIYLDNIYFYKTVITAEPSLPLTFEDGTNPVIAFDGGAYASVVNNPDMAGNSSTKVLQFNKIVGSAWYSGVVFDEDLRTTPLIDLANGTVFTINIWSPKAGIKVRFQLEGGAAPAYEVFETLNTANEWVTLTFDFASQVNASDTYPRFSIFPDFDTSNQNPITTESIYYLDNIKQQ